MDGKKKEKEKKHTQKAVSSFLINTELRAYWSSVVTSGGSGFQTE